MIPMCTVSLGSSAVKFIVFIKNSWVVWMLGWILVLCFPFASSKPNSQVVGKSTGHMWNSLFLLLHLRSQTHRLWENPLITCGTRYFYSCMFEVKSTGCGKIHWLPLELDNLHSIYFRAKSRGCGRINKSFLELASSYFIFWS